jgi:competence protein ComEC
MAHISLSIAIALIAGLSGGVLVDQASTVWLSLGLAAGWMATTIGFIRQRPRLALGGVALAVCAAGGLLGAHALDRALHPALRTVIEQRLGGMAIDPGATRQDSPITIEGRLRVDAIPTETGAVLRLDVERVWIGPCPEPAAGGVSVGVGGALHGDRLLQWTAGRLIRAPARLRRPARYLNDGLPDQERALARRGITLVGTIKSAALVEVVAPAPWWDEIAATVRAYARVALTRHVGPATRELPKPLGDAPGGPPSAAMAAAILIGDRTGLDVDVERRLQEAGTYHVIAISGGNIAILAGLFLGLLAWMGLRGRIAALCVIAALTAYAAIAAGGASVARATLMAVIYLAVRVIDQRTAAANAIGLTAVVLLLIDPLAIADVGFWLTFGATGAILIGVSRARLPTGSLTRAALTVLLATACAELALAPVAALVFQRVTLAGLLLNFAALPAMTIVQIGALLVVIADAVSLDFVAAWSGHLVHAGSAVLVESARLLDVAPWLTWRVPPPLPGVIAAYYLAVLVSLATVRHLALARVARRTALVAGSALFLWIIAAPHARIRATGDGRLHLTMIDVGQGDAVLVTFPNGRRLMVDTGGASPPSEFDIGDRVIGPSLRAGGVIDLDYLAVTHGDPDHIGGARSLVRDFQPAEIWWGVAVAHHEPAARLQAEAARARSTWRTLQRGDVLVIGGVELRVHHPPLPDWERQKVRNDDSLVLELRFGGVSVVMTGDISAQVERDLLPTLDLLPTVVLKVAHHGSGTSSAEEFVARVKPRVALIGVGRGNPYGHPVPYVLERFTNAGTEVFRTDLDGEIHVITDGKKVSVETWTGRKVWR